MQNPPVCLRRTHMNKKTIAALVSTLAFGTVAVAHAEEAAKAEKPAKAEKAKKADKADTKADDKKGGEKSCGGDKKPEAKK